MDFLAENPEKMLQNDSRRAFGAFEAFEEHKIYVLIKILCR